MQDLAKQNAQRLDAGPVICAEGYLFELERRGYLQAGAFVPEVVLERPDLLKQLVEKHGARDETARGTALAELEDAFGADDLVALTERFATGRLKARDLTRIIGAGLRGAGEAVSDARGAMLVDEMSVQRQ